MKDSKKQFIEDAKIVTELYSDLRHTPTESNFYQLIGDIPIFDANNHLRDIFAIKLVHSSYYPKGFGRLYEIGDDIPKTIEWHKYDNEQCCVCAVPEELIQQQKRNSILAFLQEYAIPFLVTYLYKKEYGKYPNGEYEHGHTGTVQWYKEQFPLCSLSKTRDIVAYIALGNRLPKPFEKCICNSGKKFKKCHYLICQRLKLIPKDYLFQHIKILNRGYYN